jgi:hypothetical protein
MREHGAAGFAWWVRAPAVGDAMDRVLWRFRRLRCMGPAEIVHRLRQALAMRRERWNLADAAAVQPPDITRASRPWILSPAIVDATACLKAADRIAAGRFDVFALRDVSLGSPPPWNRDPRTGRDAPLEYGKLLDYRNPRLVGDIKYLWEPNRHLHLVTLAQAYDLSGDERYFEVIRRHLESWLDACPFLKGANWSSALEAAIRLVNWAVTWQLLGGVHSPLFHDAAGERLRRRWLDSIHQHASFVDGHFSLYSSANNHLVGEAAGLFIAAVTWPYWPRAGGWLGRSKAILEREALLQNAPDGVNREQAVAYQQFELDLLLLPLLAGKANGVEFPATYRARIERMLEYLASIMDAGGHVPMIGDCDDGAVLKLDHRREFCRYRSTLATGALLFRRGEFKAKAGALDDKTRWLFGVGADAAYRRLDARSATLPVRQAFPAGGYYVLGTDFESPEEIRLVADAGPLGYETIAAHGHADALAFTLSVGGTEFLIDPGTYAYHTHGQWRQYFRGTAAHNTVQVDGVDQSQQGGNFMWLRKAVAARSLWQSSKQRDVFEGSHDGYRRLRDPVVHRRRITLEKDARRVIVEDTLEMTGTHRIQLFFHCSERCEVERLDHGYAIRQGGRRIVLALPQAPGADSRVHIGSVAPISGWISRRFDEKVPAPTVEWQARLTGRAVLRSEIAC